MSREVDSFQSSQHSEHAQQVLRLTCSLYGIKLYTKKSHDEIFHFGEMLDTVAPLRVLSTLSGERGNKEVGDLKSNRQNVANNKLERLQSFKLLKMLLSFSDDYLDVDYEVRQRSVKMSSVEIHSAVMGYLEKERFANTVISDIELVTKVQIRRPQSILLQINSFVRLSTGGYGRILQILLVDINLACQQNNMATTRKCLLLLQPHTISGIQAETTLPLISEESTKAVFDISAVTSLVTLMPYQIPSDFPRRPRAYFWKDLPALPLVLWDELWMWNHPSSPLHWFIPDYPPEYLLPIDNDVACLADLLPQYKEKWKNDLSKQ